MKTFLALLVAMFVAGSAFAQVDARTRAEALKHLRTGQENLRGEKLDKAEEEFRAAIKLDPLLELAHYGLGQTYMAMKRFEEAAWAYKNCKDAFMQQAASGATAQLEQEQRVQEQIQQLQDQKNLMSGRSFSSTAGMAAQSIQRIDAMIAELRARRYTRVDGRQPDTPTWISVALGSAYFRSGAMADAEREYRDAVRVDPKLAEAHNNLAVVCLLTGRADQAEAEIAAAEKAGFKVNPQLKADIRKAREKR